MDEHLTPLEVSVACFEGPLAVLITLIKKNKVSIWDIPLASITERFLQYVELVSEMNLRIAEDFIEMASLIIFIKSKMLLPSEENDGEENPAEQLVERIMEFERIRHMSGSIDGLTMLDRDVFSRGAATIDREMEYDLLELSRLFFELMKNREERYIEIKEIRPTLEEKIRALRAALDTSGLYVWTMDGEEEQNEKVATILGMLELTKVKVATLLQRRPFGKVVLRKKGYQTADEQSAGGAALSREDTN
jgi:segregation and condensation protein A